MSEDGAEIVEVLSKATREDNHVVEIREGRFGRGGLAARST